MSIETAIRLALHAHSGQTDKNGEPYVLHVLRVGLAGLTENQRVVGFLHDVLEDAPDFWPAVKLRFNGEITDAIITLSRNKGETYEQFIERISHNSLATRVKINDIQDNLRPLQRNMTCRDLARRMDYHIALAYLTERLPDD